MVNLLLDSVPPEALMEIAENMLGNKRTDEAVIYYRKPLMANGKPHSEAGWICWSDSQAGKQLDLWKKGWQPLNKYGEIRVKKSENQPDGPFDRYGPWGPILCHPDGPGEFPVDQILTFRWYDPERCPVPSARFPQLREWLAEGHEIDEYDCPECTLARYAKPVYLARHLRIAHNYERHEIIALGKEMNVDFSKELVRNGRVRRTYNLEDLPEPVQLTEPEPQAEPIVVKRITPSSHKGAPAPKRVYSEEQKQVLRDRLAVARSKKAGQVGV